MASVVADSLGDIDLGFDSPNSGQEAIDDIFEMELPAVPAHTSFGADGLLTGTPSQHGEAARPAQRVGSPGTPKSRRKLHQQIEKQLTESIPRQRVSLAYRIGLAMTAAFMLMLPLVYLCLVGLAVYLTYVYAFETFPSLLTQTPVRGRRGGFAIILYFSPILIGCIAVVFMIKPLFMTLVMSGAMRERSISCEAEPILFSLVDRICDVIGAPKPSRINVDASANASASVNNGIKGLFRRELVLTIGVPLVTCLSVRQLAGVLAHEFGHFSHGMGMRANMIIGAINS